MAHFRSQKPDLFRLREALRIPHVVRTGTRDRVDSMEALCILLKRFSYPNRSIELRRMFGRGKGTLSRVFYWVLRYIDQNFTPILQSWNVTWLQEEDFHLYSGVICAIGRVLPGCFGFFDGTATPIARPKRLQRHCFSGHKRHH